MEHFIETVRKYPCLWNTMAIEYRDQELKDAAWTEVMKETNLSSVKEVKLKWKKLRDSYRDALKRQSDMLAKEPANPAKKNYPWKYMGRMQFLQPHMSNRKKAGDAALLGAHNGAGGAGGAAGAEEPPAHEPPAQLGDAPSSDESDSDADSAPPAKRKACSQLTVIDRKLDYLCKHATAAPVAPGKRPFAESPGYAERRREPAGGGGALPAVPDPLDIFFNSMCQATKRFPFPTQIKIKRVLFEAVTEAEEALVAEQQSYAALWARGARGERGAASTTSSDAEPAERADAPDADERKPF